jgi:3-isopropylmalate/(R)-2-methylmalate dehydratase small subunit
MQTFGGPALFLDRSDINTDEIIPAKYLTEVTKDALKPYLLEDLKVAGFDRQSETFRKARVIVTRDNFGCGSSREHAPWALEVNGITTVIARSFARIFRQNMFNCGMLAIELPSTDIESLFKLPNRLNTICDIDVNEKTLIFSWAPGKSTAIHFEVSPFDEALVKAGGWLEYADAKY